MQPARLTTPDCPRRGSREHQQKQRVSHADSVITVSTMIFAAGTVTGVLTGTKMIDAMAAAAVAVIPARLAGDLPAIPAVTSMPFRLARGKVERFALPGLGALDFVLHAAPGGGVTRALALDAHGECLASAVRDLGSPMRRRRALQGILFPTGWLDSDLASVIPGRRRRTRDGTVKAVPKG